MIRDTDYSHEKNSGLYGACFIPDFKIVDIPPVETVLGEPENRVSGGPGES